jgi:hypothetical protein
VSAVQLRLLLRMLRRMSCECELLGREEIMGCRYKMRDMGGCSEFDEIR